MTNLRTSIVYRYVVIHFFEEEEEEENGELFSGHMKK